MDSRNDHSRIDSTYHLLALCARAESHPLMVAELARQVQAFTNWDELPAQAELHGMAPLVWHHLRKAGISIPLKTEQTLSGLYLRHRVFNQAHTQVLLEINSLFESAGIRALVLKGLALAYQYYPDPALRPVSDIDLLLNQADVLPALDLLAGASFRVNSALRSSSGLLPKELTADSPLRNEIRTHIELHHYDPRQRSIKDYTPDNEFIGFRESPHPLALGDQVVYTPASMDILNYLCRHLQRHLFEATANKPLQLKWTADIISLVERNAETMDWDYLQRHDQTLLQRLEVFYSLTPIPEHLVKVIPVRQSPPSSGLNQYPKGWPQFRFREQRQIGFLGFVTQTFTPPSVWWLRLYYGIGERSSFGYGQFLHRIRIFKFIFWAMIHRLAGIAVK